jgi:dihydrofolate synthase/folylpolyglutamate synthase
LPRLEGRHQLDNAATAIATAKAFFGRAIAPESVAAGLRTVNWPGRLQRLKEGPLVEGMDADETNAPDIWVDGGHNPGAAAVVAQAMADLDERVSRPLYLIVAMGANKDASGVFQQFKGLARRVIAIPMPADHEGHAPRALAALASEAGIAAGIAANPADGVAQALSDAGAETPRILITGSLYLVGEVLKENA